MLTNFNNFPLAVPTYNVVAETFPGLIAVGYEVNKAFVRLTLVGAGPPV